MSSSDFVPLRKHQQQQSQNTSSSSVSKSSQNVHIAKSTSADTLRSRHGIEVEDDTGQIPDPITTFDEIVNLPHHLKTFLKRTKRLVKPTPVQMQAIGCLEASRDVICLSATGTGKTLAYLLPMCSFLWKNRIKILQQSYFRQLQQQHQQQYQNHQQQYPQQNKSQQNEICRPSCLIIVPTRELMHQVLENAQELVNALDPLTFKQVGNGNIGEGCWPEVGHNSNYWNNQTGHNHPQQQHQQPLFITNQLRFQSTGIYYVKID